MTPTETLVKHRESLQKSLNWFVTTSTRYRNSVGVSIIENLNNSRIADECNEICSNLTLEINALNAAIEKLNAQ